LRFFIDLDICVGETGLTQREEEILACIFEGLQDKEIASKLGIGQPLGTRTWHGLLRNGRPFKTGIILKLLSSLDASAHLPCAKVTHCQQPWRFATVQRWAIKEYAILLLRKVSVAVFIKVRGLHGAARVCDWFGARNAVRVYVNDIGKSGRFGGAYWVPLLLTRVCCTAWHGGFRAIGVWWLDGSFKAWKMARVNPALLEGLPYDECKLGKQKSRREK